MAMGIGNEGKITAEMNVTPLIDVLLVLLVIFILINPAKKTGMPTEVPQAAVSSSAPPPESTIVLEVESDAADHVQVMINHQPVVESLLQRRLAEIYKQRSDRVLFLKADEKLDFYQVADVLDTIRAADPSIRVGLMPNSPIAAD